MKLLSCAVCAIGLLGIAQEPAVAADSGSESSYQPLQAFAPFDYRFPVNRYRSASGQPGPDYWQNRADYAIRAELHPDSKILTGTETLTYTNNSPDTLRYLWLQMDQNIHRRDARGNFTRDQMPALDAHTNGYEVKSVQVRYDGDYVDVETTSSDTRMRVELPEALDPDGSQVKVRISYQYKVPESGRNDWYQSKDGNVFEMAQWFPRPAVYDDLHGWDTQPYLNNEFYLEYGNIDYRVTAPADMMLVGSGKLMNPEDVYTDTQRKRLKKARHSDNTVMIRTADEVHDPASRPDGTDGKLTWHFRMNNTRDVAFGASKAYVLDAARINIPDGDNALAISAYPPESATAGDWENSTQYVKFTIEQLSQWYPYPWETAVAEAGTVGGMEYPGMVFDYYKADEDMLFWLTVHEMGHNWYPMIVGSNERRYAWMDEGLNTFVDAMVQDAWGRKHDGQYAPKSDSEYAPDTGDPARDIISVLEDEDAPPILTRPDVIPGQYRHPVTYFKTAYGLTLLRNQILGKDRFDKAFREYTHDWAFKHPSPSDFFRAMESAAGEDLAWFWNGWFAHNWKLDLAVTDVGYIDDEPGKGTVVTVANLDKLPMPATLEVDYTDGSSKRVRVPVATWMQHDHFDVKVDGDKQVKAAVIDPDGNLPDVNRDNNAWHAD